MKSQTFIIEFAVKNTAGIQTETGFYEIRVQEPIDILEVAKKERTYINTFRLKDSHKVSSISITKKQ